MFQSTIDISDSLLPDPDELFGSEGNPNTQYQQLSHMNNGFRWSFSELPKEKGLSYDIDAVIEIVDPLPLPPGFANGIGVEPRHDRELAFPSFIKRDILPAMQVASQDALKSSHESMNERISLFHNNSSSSGASNSHMARPTKKAKQITDGWSNKLVGEGISKDSIPTRSIPMAMKCDGEYLSEYQCLIRQQIDIFEASEDDVVSRDRGRNTAIHIGQVGIRCKHCAGIPAIFCSQGASYFTLTLKGIYQSSHKMTVNHLLKSCIFVPASVKQSLVVLKSDRRRAPGGIGYWAEGARILGVREMGKIGLRFDETTTTQVTK